MGLKNKMLKNVSKYVAKNIPEVISKNGGADNVINKLSEMAAIYGRITTSDNFEKKDDKKYLYLKAPSFSISSIIKMFTMNFDGLEQEYEICDDEGNLKFKSKMTSGRICIYNKNREIGYVKTPTFSIGNPLYFETDVRKCSIFLNNKLLCKLKRYKSFGDLYYEGYEGKIEIETGLSKTKIIKIKYGNKIIATLNQLAYKFSKELENKFIIEYDNEKDEEIISLVSIGLNIVGLDNMDYGEKQN